MAVDWGDAEDIDTEFESDILTVVGMTGKIGYGFDV